MSTYVVTRKSDGVEVYRYDHTDKIVFVTWPEDEFDYDLAPPEPPPPEMDVLPVYGGRRTLSKLEFLRLFTAQERIGLRAAAKVNPVVEDYMALMELSLEISLDDPDTVTGLRMLEAASMLGAGRADEILRG